MLRQDWISWKPQQLSCKIWHPDLLWGYQYGKNNSLKRLVATSPTGSAVDFSSLSLFSYFTMIHTDIPLQYFIIKILNLDLFSLTSHFDSTTAKARKVEKNPDNKPTILLMRSSGSSPSPPPCVLPASTEEEAGGGGKNKTEVEGGASIFTPETEGTVGYPCDCTLYDSNLIDWLIDIKGSTRLHLIWMYEVYSLS